MEVNTAFSSEKKGRYTGFLKVFGKEKASMIRPIRILHATSDFKKAFQKLPDHVQELAIKKDRAFRENAFAASLRTHKLKGPLDGYWSYSINYDYRVLFRFINAREVLYFDVGTHSIYR